ncbi:MAG: hypothetical protein LC679_17140 [Intrasporangiaceae bacterium]|nr:hypothetical protein [Intrasporangiaceae bacterium]
MTTVAWGSTAPGVMTSFRSIGAGPGPLELPDGPFDVVLTQPNGSTVALRGDGELAEEIDGLSFGFDASSFFQVTTHGAHAIVDAVLDAVGQVRGALVWDLYAGVGLLSLPLARAGAEVVAVEGHPSAAAHAVTNAAGNNLDLEVLGEDVATMTARAAGPTPDRDPPDVVVLDPPRSGAERRSSPTSHGSHRRRSSTSPVTWPHWPVTPAC